MASQEEKKEGDAVPAGGGDTLGEFLRRTRIAGRIDLNRMAADTRLNADTITAVEKNDFARIPGETYRKIFIKNIARYLGLNPEEVFQRYLRETAVPSAPSEKPPQAARPAAGGADAAAGPGGAAKTEALGAIKPPIKNIAIFLIILSAVFVLLLVSQRDESRQTASPAQVVPPAAPADTALKDSSRPQPAVKPAAPVPPKADGPAEKPSPQAPAEKPVPPATPRTDGPAAKPAAPAPPRTEGAAAKPAAPAMGMTGGTDTVSAVSAFADESRGALRVRVTADTDSLKVLAFRNNRLWANTFRKGGAKIFASDTALYFNLSGPDMKVTLHLNNVLLRYSPKIGRIIRVAPGGVTYITAETWQQLAAPKDSANAR